MRSTRWRSICATLVVVAFLVSSGLGKTVADSLAHSVYLPVILDNAEQVSPDPTATLTPSPTLTLAPTIPVDLVLSGKVYDASLGPSAPVGGAMVSVLMCVPRRYYTASAADGNYTLPLPNDYLNACSEITLEVWATGYQNPMTVISVEALRANPVRDLALMPVTPAGTTTARPSREPLLVSGSTP